jgi:hypothetical protein
MAKQTLKADSHITCCSFPFDLHSAAVFVSHIPWHVMCESALCVNQTWPHFVNQMGKPQSKPLAERHGRGTAEECHGMCESALTFQNYVNMPKNGNILYIDELMQEQTVPGCQF